MKTAMTLLVILVVSTFEQKKDTKNDFKYNLEISNRALYAKSFHEKDGVLVVNRNIIKK